MGKEQAVPVIVILAGGTGGHIFPALAVAEELKRRGYRIHWLGTREGLEAEIVPKHGFDITFIPVKGVVGNGFRAMLQAPVRVVLSIIAGIRVMRKMPVVGVLGLGGFVTGPGSIAAQILGKPLVIHEQNAVAGLTNKIVSHFATLVLAAFPGAFGKSIKNVIVTGNPTRSNITPTLRLTPVHSPMRLLVLGGSKGALSINRCMLKVQSRLSEKVEIWLQTGQMHYDLMVTESKEMELRIKIEPFIDDMKAAYDWADIVLCRSGALTVSELANVRKPSILIPYPWHKDQQQLRNARYLVDSDAAILVRQSELTVNRVVKILEDLMSEPERLSAMEKAAGLCAHPNATEKVVTLCLQAMGETCEKH